MTNIEQNWQSKADTTLDFIIVGSGAGGAPLAARLAERGYEVLVVEMGPKKPQPLPGSFVDCTDVPLLHSESTEDERHSLKFFVDHYGGGDEGRNKRRNTEAPTGHDEIDPEDEKGIFYPRSQGIGGCTLHNAMITICGPSEDWDEIAEATGDPSWHGERMRAYFERLENCNYDRPSLWQRLKGAARAATNWRRGRHGHNGWLETSMADLRLLTNEKKFLKIVAGAALQSLNTDIETLTELKSGKFAELDPNHWETMRRSQEGLSQIPCAITSKGERSSPRERLLRAELDCPNLHILTDAFVTRLQFACPPNEQNLNQPPEVTGVRILPQAHVYEADTKAAKPSQDWEGSVKTVFCKREVILCGGTFNTPQTLMLSGIGPAKHLNEEMNIPVRKDLPAVGKHLQDRYEVPIVATLADRFKSLDDLQLSSKRIDPALQDWIANRGLPQGSNVYATNGGLIGVFKRSRQAETEIPDLFMFALAGRFPGYHVGWSKPSALAPGENGIGPEGAAAEKRSLTWLVLKARSRNDAGSVKLRSSIPFRRPKIDFNIFPDDDEEKKTKSDKDIAAICEGVEFIEQMLLDGKRKGLIESFELPNGESDGQIMNLSNVVDDVDQPDRIKKRKTWIKDVAWGHHACGTCRIGKDETDSVVNSRFKVHGVKGLRIVDASVFPRIPGYFIVTNIYMISEKAADVISEDYPIDSTGNSRVTSNLAEEPIFSSSGESRDRNAYPARMERAEAKLIKARREALTNE